MDVKALSREQALSRLEAMKHKHWGSYLAMYSSWLGGIVEDPSLMQVPVDDHIVHRGDAVFEAFKCRGKKIYLLQEHLDRLERSAKAIYLELPNTKDEIKSILEKLQEVVGEENLLFRLYLSRGPGGFSTNPYECISSQLYIVATRLKSPASEKYSAGVTVARSEIPMKEDWLATVKSCNYLPNVMMKKEAIDRGIDFTVNFDSEYGLGEGSTENIAVVTAQDELIFPPFDKVLRGTTLSRLAELAQSLVKEGVVKSVGERLVGLEQIRNAKEIFLVGTTLDVLPVTSFDGQLVGEGKVGPVAKYCLKLITEDQKNP